MSLDDMNSEDSTQSGQDSLTENLEDLDPSFVSGGRKEPNKGALGFLGALLIGGAAFYFFYLRTGPASASAAATQDQKAATTIDEFLHGNGGNAHLMAQTLSDSQKVVSEFQASSRKFQIPLGDLSTNPFRLHPSETTKQSDDDLAARSREQMLADRARIQREAGTLELQSVMRGSNSACMINNSLCHVGDQVGGFTIDEIRARTVVVHQGPYRFELAMKKLKAGRGD